MLIARNVMASVSVGLIALSACEVSGQSTSPGPGQATSAGSGQAYPNRPIRLVTSAAGGGNDFEARLIALGIAAPLGRPLIVDNRTAQISAEIVSQAAPDGHTLLYQSSTLWLATLLQKAPYDPLADFAPIALAVRSINILVVHPSLPVKTVRDLIALAKARPGVLNYGSSAIGSSLHLAGELFKAMAGVNIVHIPYKATGIAVNDLISGQLQLMFSSISPVIAHVKSGRLRALAGTSAGPSALLPGMPTVAGSGLPGYESVSVGGFFAPAQTPAAIVNRLNQEIVRFINQPEVKEKFLSTGSEVVASSPSEFAATMRSDMATFGKLIKDANIRVD